ncbi:hypothetical protein CEP52_003739 [Fusarium oligoseptatum]|uniref:Uncharacterized protein n=1 Tax=Fusarium oligoseptatum TaxID=2604345 RepID=A0A428U746_9HYPO|nr:hypothetical protein CEP52_003739 [Fusarium oligoseptatum]
MCIAHYLHYHHIPPCPRPVSYLCHYSYCAAALYDPISGEPLAPCDDISDSSPGGDISNPCTMGLCLINPRCKSGACRLEDLGGRWVCCACGRGRNSSYQCLNYQPTAPDTFCYHQICENCTEDKT